MISLVGASEPPSALHQLLHTAVAQRESERLHSAKSGGFMSNYNRFQIRYVTTKAFDVGTKPGYLISVPCIDMEADRPNA